MVQRNGLRRACLYVPHQLGLCGPEITKQDHQLILQYIQGKEVDVAELKAALMKFKTAYSYYQKIAAACGIKDPFDPRVSSAYWLGNQFLGSRNFRLEMPYHNYYVLTATDFSNDKERDLCRISWGVIKRINSRSSKALVSCRPLRPLIKIRNLFYLGGLTQKQVNWKKDFTADLRPGQIVSMHWGCIIEVLTLPEIESLEKYTEQAIRLFNDNSESSR